MAETSWWWDGHTVGDATSAPYEADNWADTEALKYLIDTNNQGVIGGVLNNLEVTNGGGSNVIVDTGAAIVNGRLYENDAALTFVVAGASVWWIVGLVVNYAAQTVRAFARGSYGSEVLALASLVHNAGVSWEIPLATVLTTAGGAVSSVTDERKYTIRPAYAYLFVPANGGYNSTDGIDIVRNNSVGLPLPNSKLSYAYGHALLPPNFYQVLAVKTLAIPGGDGNVYATSYIAYDLIGGTYNTHNSNTGYSAVAVVSNIIETIHTVTPSNMDEGGGDLMCFYTGRDAINVLDTLNASLYLSGWLVQYATLF